MAAPGGNDRLLKTKEVADRVGVGIETVQNWLNAGTLVGMRLPGGWRVRESVLNAWIAKHENARAKDA